MRSVLIQETGLFISKLWLLSKIWMRMINFHTSKLLAFMAALISPGMGFLESLALDGVATVLMVID